MSQGGAPVGTAFVEVLPKTDGFVSTLSGQLKSAITEAAGGVDASPLTKGLSTGLLALGGAAIAGIYTGIKATQDWVTQVQTLQRVTGQTAEGASTLAATADAMGVSVSSLSGAMTVLSGKVTSNNAAFDKYGIATKDATGATLPLDQILAEIQAKYQSLPEGVDRTSLATSLFGRSGRQLLPILGLTSDQMAEMASKAKDLGLVLSQNDVDAAQKLKIAQAELGDAFKGLQIQIGKVFIPILTAMTKAMTAAVEVFARIPVPIKIAVIAFLGLNVALTALRVGWGLLVKNFETLTAATKPVADALQASTDATVAQTVATDDNTVSTYNNIASNESSNATQVATAESYGQAAQALDVQTAATDVNTVSTNTNAAASATAAASSGALSSATATQLTLFDADTVSKVADTTATEALTVATTELTASEGAATGIGAIFSNTLGAIGGAVKGGISAIGEFISGGLEALTGALSGAFDALNGFSIGLAGFATPVGWVIAIGAAVVGLVVIIVKNWNTIKAITIATFNAVGKAITATFNYIKNSAVSKVILAVFQQLQSAFDDFINAIKTVGSEIAAAIEPAIQALGQVFAALGPILGPIIITILKFIGVLAALVVLGPIVAALELLRITFLALAVVIRDVVAPVLQFISKWLSVIIVGAINLAIDAINVLIDAYNKLPFGDITPLNEVSQATIGIADSNQQAADATNAYADAAIRAGYADKARIASQDTLQTALGDTQAAIVSQDFGGINSAINQFTKSSGVDLSQYKTNLQNYISDPTSATVKDVRANISGIKHAYDDWVKGIASSLTDYGSVLDQFQNKNNVDLGKATQSLNTYGNQLHKLGTDINILRQRYGSAATPFIQLLQTTGTAYLGLANSAVSSNRKAGQAFFDGFKYVKSQAQITADAIAGALDTSFNKILREFKIMYNQILISLGKPIAFNINATPAERALQTLDTNINQLTSKTHYITIQGQYIPPTNTPGGSGGGSGGGGGGGGKGGAATGGIIAGAAGFIARSPTYLVGEGHYPTPAGTGGEAIIPLNLRGRKILKEALGGMWGGGTTVVAPKMTVMNGQFQMTDWRNGLASLDSELGWEEAVRTR